MPVFELNFAVDDREPVGGEEGPVAEGFAVDVHSEAGEDFRLPIVRKVTAEAVRYHFGNESGGGDAAVLQGGRQGTDDGFGGEVVDEDEFPADELNADEFAGHEFELGGVEFFAGCTEDLAAERVNGLFEADDLGSLARDDLIAPGEMG